MILPIPTIISKCFQAGGSQGTTQVDCHPIDTYHSAKTGTQFFKCIILLSMKFYKLSSCASGKSVWKPVYFLATITVTDI